MLALVTFTVLALMAFTFVVALVFLTFVITTLAFAHAHSSNATKDEVLLLIESLGFESFPSGLHGFAFSFHLFALLLAFGFGSLR